MGKTLCLISALALLAGLLFGCAETPEVSAVLQKDQEQLIETANSLEDPSATISEQVNAPQRVEDSTSGNDGTLIVTVDADVTLPEADTVKILRVTGQDFTQEQVDAWSQALFGSQTLYDAQSFTEATKSELEAQLLEAQRALAEAEASGEGSIEGQLYAPADDGEEGGEPKEMTRADLLRESIEGIQQALETAPEERIPQETTNELSYHEGQSYTWTSFAVPNETNTGLIAMNVGNFPGCQQFTYVDQNRWSYDGASFYYTYDEVAAQKEYMKDRWQLFQELPEPELTQAEAEACGRAFLEHMNLDHLVLARAEVGMTEYRSDSLLQQAETLTGAKGWKLEYIREVDGIPVSYPAVAAASPDEGELWYYERLVLFITDDGITEAEYTAPHNLQETLVENCKLMDFDSILKIFQKMMPITYHDRWPESDATNLRDEFIITDIQFGYTRITEQNSSYSGLLVPTWTFYGREEWSYVSSKDGSQYGGTIGGDFAWMTINAIDGSVIDLNNGY